MKLRILSDLHLEFGPFDYVRGGEDVLILAGDIGLGVAGMKWIKSIDHPNTIMIAGNHEFYKHDINETLRNLKSESTDIISFVENDIIIIDDVRFICATLWTDYNLYGSIVKSKMICQLGINDHRLIRKGNYVFSPDDAEIIYKTSQSFIEKSLRDNFDGRTIVITHHLPSEISINPMYSKDELNPAYASNLDYLFYDYKIDLWIHGHTHSSCDYMLDKTRVVCNPRGYVGHGLNPDFNPNLIVEI